MVTSFLLWFAIGLALVTSIFSESIIKYTYGSNYSDSIEVLVLLIWINVIIFFNSCWNQWHIIKGESNYVLYFHFLTASSNIVFNFILIPELGVIGAAYAIILSLVLSLIVFSFVDKSTFPLLVRAMTFGRVTV